MDMQSGIPMAVNLDRTFDLAKAVGQGNPCSMVHKTGGKILVSGGGYTDSNVGSLSTNGKSILVPLSGRELGKMAEQIVVTDPAISYAYKVFDDLSVKGIGAFPAASDPAVLVNDVAVNDAIPSDPKMLEHKVYGGKDSPPFQTGFKPAHYRTEQGNCSPALSYAAALKSDPNLNIKAGEGRGGDVGHSRYVGSSEAKKSFHDGGLTEAFGQIFELEGQKCATFSNREVEMLAAPFKFALIGKFPDGYPTMKTLRERLAGFKLRGEFSVALLEQRHVIIRLSCEEDYTRLFSRQELKIAGYSMRVFKWTPDFVPKEETPFAPVWVKFPYLPIHLFDSRSLFTIASLLGNPLRIDDATLNLTRGFTPRVCIELNLTKTPLKEVIIILDGKKLVQEVEYENLPKFCGNCKLLGHNVADCLLKTQAVHQSILLEKKRLQKSRTSRFLKLKKKALPYFKKIRFRKEGQDLISHVVTDNLEQQVVEDVVPPHQTDSVPDPIVSDVVAPTAKKIPHLIESESEEEFIFMDEHGRLRIDKRKKKERVEQSEPLPKEGVKVEELEKAETSPEEGTEESTSQDVTKNKKLQKKRKKKRK